MYGWIWRRLPGGTPAKLVLVALLLAAVALLLWFVIYPWAAVHVPFDPSGLG